jgi:hypothetical protein
MGFIYTFLQPPKSCAILNVSFINFCCEEASVHSRDAQVKQNTFPLNAHHGHQ